NHLSCACVSLFLPSNHISCDHYPSSFTHPSTTHIYTLSLHDALPIWLDSNPNSESNSARKGMPNAAATSLPSHSSDARSPEETLDRKSTRLNSSHQIISYAVFCLKKKTATSKETTRPHLSRERNVSAL